MLMNEEREHNELYRPVGPDSFAEDHDEHWKICSFDTHYSLVYFDNFFSS